MRGLKKNHHFFQPKFKSGTVVRRRFIPGELKNRVFSQCLTVLIVVTRNIQLSLVSSNNHTLSKGEVERHDRNVGTATWILELYELFSFIEKLFSRSLMEFIRKIEMVLWIAVTIGILLNDDHFIDFPSKF